MEIQDVACNAVLYSQLFGFFFFCKTVVPQWCFVCCCNPGFILASVQLFCVFKRFPFLFN